MKTDNMRKWTARLRTPGLKQARTVLATVPTDDSDIDDAAFCCLGVGCVEAGIPVRAYPVEHPTEDEGWCLSFDGAVEMAPTSLHTWLGVRPQNEDSEDVFLDIPEGWCYVKDFEVQGGDQMVKDLAAYSGASSLNDDLHLSFSAIADMVDYFGVRDNTAHEARRYFASMRESEVQLLKPGSVKAEVAERIFVAKVPGQGDAFDTEVMVTVYPSGATVAYRQGVESWSPSEDMDERDTE